MAKMICPELNIVVYFYAKLIENDNIQDEKQNQSC